MLDIVLVFVLFIVVCGLISEVNSLHNKLNRPKRKYTKDMSNKRWHKGGVVKRGRGRPRKNPIVTI